MHFIFPGRTSHDPVILRKPNHVQKKVWFRKFERVNPACCRIISSIPVDQIKLSPVQFMLIDLGHPLGRNTSSTSARFHRILDRPIQRKHWEKLKRSSFFQAFAAWNYTWNYVETGPITQWWRILPSASTRRKNIIPSRSGSPQKSNQMFL